MFIIKPLSRGQAQDQLQIGCVLYFKTSSPLLQLVWIMLQPRVAVKL